MTQTADKMEGRPEFQLEIKRLHSEKPSLANIKRIALEDNFSGITRRLCRFPVPPSHTSTPTFLLDREPLPGPFLNEITDVAGHMIPLVGRGIAASGCEQPGRGR